MNTLMECSHVAQGTDGNGNPVCVICVGIDPGARVIAGKPDLTGRMSVCAYKNPGKYFHAGDHDPKQSSWDLAFFEYLGPGSRRAKEMCGNCGYYESAHPLKNHKCEGFEPHGPYEFDSHYCGCWGWD